MKTWLTCDENGCVHRHCNYDDGIVAESEYIGTIEHTKDGKLRWFQTYGDDRTFTVAEMKQIIEFIEGKNFLKKLLTFRCG